MICSDWHQNTCAGKSPANATDILHITSDRCIPRPEFIHFEKRTERFRAECIVEILNITFVMLREGDEYLVTVLWYVMTTQSCNMASQMVLGVYKRGRPYLPGRFKAPVRSGSDFIHHMGGFLHTDRIPYISGRKARTWRQTRENRTIHLINTLLPCSLLLSKLRSSSIVVKFKMNEALKRERATRRHTLARIENLIKQTPSYLVLPGNRNVALMMYDNEIAISCRPRNDVYNLNNEDCIWVPKQIQSTGSLEVGCTVFCILVVPRLISVWGWSCSRRD